MTATARWAFRLVVIVLLGTAPAAAQPGTPLPPTPNCEAFAEAHPTTHVGRGGASFAASELDERPELSEDMADGLGALARALRRRGTVLVMLPVPYRGSAMPHHVADASFDADRAADGYRELVEAIRSTGAEAIDLLAPLRRDEATAPPGFFLRDVHWNEHGVAAAAARVASRLRELAELPRPTAVEILEGDVSDVTNFRTEDLRALCDVEVATETNTALEARTGEATAADLFADAPSEVVVVGTSFTRDKYGFPARLSEALGLVVPSYAIGGGRAFASIDGYLASWAFDDDPPAVLLWEMRVNLLTEGDPSDDFARLVAAAAGACPPERASAHATTSLTPAGAAAPHRPFHPLFPVVDGSGARLVLEFEDRSIREFELLTTSASDGLRVERSARAPSHGRYLLPLPDGLLRPADLGLALPEGAQGELRAWICAPGG